jgi:hypothetical protein
VSRYKVDRSREFIPGYKVIGGHWRGRGINHYKSALGVGAKAKSVTNNLPLLSVLGGRSNLITISVIWPNLVTSLSRDIYSTPLPNLLLKAK